VLLGGVCPKSLIAHLWGLVSEALGGRTPVYAADRFLSGELGESWGGFQRYQ